MPEMIGTVYICLKWIRIKTSQLEQFFFWYIEPMLMNTGHKPCLHDKELGFVSYNSTTDPQS